MIQHLTRRLIDLAVPPRTHGERWPAADGVEAVYIDLARLSDAALESVRCDMLAVQQAAYCRAESATPEALQARLREHVWSSTTDRSVFSQAVLFYAAGLPVGVLHCHAVELQLAGRTCEIVRAGVTVAPAFRSLGLTSASFHVIGAAYLRLRAWTRTPRVYVGYCMSPMTFRYVHRRTPQCYPGPNAVDPLLVELHHPPAAGGGGFADIFDQMFSEFSRGAGGGQADRAGNDLRHDMNISLEEAFSGVQRDITVTVPVGCDSCEGTGSAGGGQPQTCGTCGGSGRCLSA